ncbi:hypothetical protein Phum_PHUM213820 [Pediculus humanus corporis]|uniref:Uncharacterized protein n=1 Tax=Pediculus humanus subsp. corporis TaxID=121224 RepID=E0VHN9_PEDHC|nr:uncharacterized protein Phum_PHUM213820 [Pediculus humanus corporis]EEB12925.1 hypothetical protein Phum_PHUM213820 [Pediculus humanus corporis]
MMTKMIPKIVRHYNYYSDYCKISCEYDKIDYFIDTYDLKKKYSTILKTSPCVFCLGSLYDGGYLHDLHEKIPFIKKQSEEYGDDVSMRIGMRSRITVHKKCYDDYIDRSKHKDIILKNSNSEDFSNCSVKTVISEDEIIQEPPKIKPFFCLKKFKPPQLDPVISFIKFHKRYFKYVDNDQNT